jgi:hypothetical protein
LAQVTKETITTETEVYQTDTHQFRIRKTTLTNMVDKSNFKLALGRKISRGLKPIADDTTGQSWQESFNLIFYEIAEKELDVWKALLKAQSEE